MQKHKCLSWVLLMCFTGLMASHSFAANINQPTTHFKNTLLIFVSLSMPEESLKAWLRDAKKVEARVILRGLVNNSFKDTIKRLRPLLANSGGHIEFDPIAFQTYHIDRVPAVVIKKGSNTSRVETVFGDVPLIASLNAIAQHEVVPTRLITQAVNTLRQGHGI